MACFAHHFNGRIRSHWAAWLVFSAWPTHPLLRLCRGLLMGQGSFLQPTGHVFQWLAVAQLACQQVPAFWVYHDIGCTGDDDGGVEVRQPIAHRLRRDDAVAQAVEHQGALGWQLGLGLGAAHEFGHPGQAAHAGGFDEQRVATQIA